MKCELLAMADI